MPSVIEAKNAMRDLATKAAATVADKDLSVAQKKTVLDQIMVDQKAHAQTITIHENAQRLMVGGESLGNGFAAAADSGRAMKGLATPSLRLLVSGDGLRVRLLVDHDLIEDGLLLSGAQVFVGNGGRCLGGKIAHRVLGEND